MANPQLENGHTQIANEILEHLAKMHLSPNQWRVLLCVIRKTYGFHKKVDHIANSQIVEATGLCKAVVSRALAALSDQNIISRNGRLVGVVKDWEKWQKLAVSSTSRIPIVSSIVNKSLLNRQPKLAVSSTKVSSCAVTQKKKETIQKKKETPGLSKDRQEIFELLKKRRGYNSPMPAADAVAITWMLKQGYTVVKIIECHDWLKRQEFWRIRMLNMQSVKKQIGEFSKSAGGGLPTAEQIAEDLAA